ncbi:hypothetical protein C0Q70_15787 [Pomacea canaliculata]|uniref:Fucolectin tachylectin-4 pentraxin-1 domain-containing protein n=1 Tax=Pomacea canaliculata TaxID=400727 RepID=A0A2T7NVU7_POMCA|nr:hypothetical protein C0Q70_15787 [Pomacea canaliculata]
MHQNPGSDVKGAARQLQQVAVRQESPDHQTVSWQPHDVRVPSVGVSQWQVWRALRQVMWKMSCESCVRQVDRHLWQLLQRIHGALVHRNSGMYGADCREHCGRCVDSNTCNMYDGRCETGCAPGHQPPLCKACSNNTFGVDCGSVCGHCKNNTTCDHISGRCPDGCMSGWMGELCSEENVALGKTCLQSTFASFDMLRPCNAVNDNTDGTRTDDNCIRTSTSDDSNWWEVDLWQVYPVAIELWYSRLTAVVVEKHLEGTVITVDGQQCTRIPEVTSRELHVSCSKSLYGRKVRITKESPGNLMMCEFQILLACSSGMYGPDCREHCGRCVDSNTCNMYDGRCETGCAPGHQPPLCKACSNNTFGVDCGSVCGHCNNNITCDHISGRCPDGCMSGWMGELCSEENVALGKTCLQSTFSSFDMRRPCNAVNNNIDGTRTDDNCIRTSISDDSNWWEVDLWQVYPVLNITLFGRTGYEKHLEGTVITVDGQQCTRIPEVTSRELHVSCSKSLYGRKVRITKESPGNLMMCEFQVWVCPIGKYGGHCDRSCGKCHANHACDRMTGICGSCSSGYTGPLCTETCSSGMYGPDCREHCGRCVDSNTCNMYDGRCETGCAPGHQPPLCKACSNNTFGVDCGSVCGHCKNNNTCDHISGRCPDGCMSGWMGELCSEENVALGKTCLQSTFSSFDMRRPCNAVNNNTDGTRTDDNCIRTSISDDSNWWEVDLWQVYPVLNITLFGRTGYEKHLEGTVITVDGQQCTRIPEVTSRELHVSCSKSLYGRKVRITKESPGNLMMCEFQVWVCPIGKYGEHCDRSCGKCHANHACDRLTGICGSCSSGYTGPLCTETCSSGMYGADCREHCGRCVDSNTCNMYDGRCETGCAPGHQPPLCKASIPVSLVSACITGFYGANCSRPCGHCSEGTCHSVSGECPSGCTTGYQGTHCSECCEVNKYGDKCSSSCGHCKDNVTCHHVSGECPGGCASGWTGNNCNAVCRAQKYGLGCKSSCGHCQHGKTCHHVSGVCAGGCAAGWTGMLCDTKCSAGRYGKNCDRSCGHCKDNATCSRTNGRCRGGCAAGWTGVRCKKVCRTQKYGVGCKSSCGHCQHKKTCHHVSGVCPDGCAAGWTGILCDTKFSAGRYGSSRDLSCGHCKDKATCSRTNGRCRGGCAAGWTGDRCKKAGNLEKTAGNPVVTVKTMLLVTMSTDTVRVAVLQDGLENNVNKSFLTRMYGAICNSRGPPRHSNPSHYTKEEISSGRPSLQSETRGNSNCNDVTYVEYCGASSGGSKPAASKSFISQDADRLAKEWTNFICKEVCLAEMDKNDSNEASDRCRDSVLRDQTKEEDPASDVRWPDTGCQEVYPAREAEEYCRATGDHYKCNATCAQLSGRGLHESTVEWPGSQFTEGNWLVVGGLL